MKQMGSCNRVRVPTLLVALVARRHGVTVQTVLDKYCRQLSLSAAEFDTLVGEPGLEGLRGILRRKFSQWSPAIEAMLSRFA